jgi:hypothetical protein
MKIKRLALGMAIVAVAGVNVYRMNAQSIQLSDLQLENIEMLAEGCETYQDCGFSAVYYETKMFNKQSFRYCGPGCPIVKGKNAHFEYCAWVSYDGIEA